MSSTLTDLQGLTRDSATPAVPLPPIRWKTRILLPAAIIGAALLLLLFVSIRTVLPATPVRVVPVMVKTVEGGSGNVTVQAPGWLEPDPHPNYVAALADGVVDELLVLEGDPVEAGQVVARLIDDDARLSLQRAEADLAQRRSELLSAQANRAAAQLQLEHLVERTRAVAVGEAAVAEARAETRRVEADVAVERARMMELQDEYNRKSGLTESQAVAEAAVARLRLRLEAQKATVEAAMARAAVLDAGLARAEAELRAARTDRELLIEEHRAVAISGAAVTTAEAFVSSAEAVRDEVELRLARMQVRAPVAGIVMRRLASPGSKLTRSGAEHSSHVLHLYDPRHLQVRVDVPLADAANVSVGQSAEVTVEVLPDRTFTGRITRVVHQADIQKNTMEVKVAIDHPTSELKPDMLARVRFLALNTTVEGSARQRVFAPRGLIRNGGDDGSFALVVTGLVEQRGRVERRAVAVGGRRLDDWVEIEGGLQVGDLLIADPPPGLRPGARIRVVGEQPAVGGGENAWP